MDFILLIACCVIFLVVIFDLWHTHKTKLKECLRRFFDIGDDDDKQSTYSELMESHQKYNPSLNGSLPAPGQPSGSGSGQGQGQGQVQGQVQGNPLHAQRGSLKGNKGSVSHTNSSGRITSCAVTGMGTSAGAGTGTGSGSGAKYSPLSPPYSPTNHGLIDPELGEQVINRPVIGDLLHNGVLLMLGRESRSLWGKMFRSEKWLPRMCQIYSSGLFRVLSKDGKIKAQFDVNKSTIRVQKLTKSKYSQFRLEFELINVGGNSLSTLISQSAASKDKLYRFQSAKENFDSSLEDWIHSLQCASPQAMGDSDESSPV